MRQQTYGSFTNTFSVDDTKYYKTFRVLNVNCTIVDSTIITFSNNVC